MTCAQEVLQDAADAETVDGGCGTCCQRCRADPMDHAGASRGGQPDDDRTKPDCEGGEHAHAVVSPRAPTSSAKTSNDASLPAIAA
jgi:hypothetical protein